MRRYIAALLLLLTIDGFSCAFAMETFVVSDMRLEGLQRISAGTVFNYLPIKVGDIVDSDRTADAIRSLFKTGFFKDVRIEKEGNTLVIFVVERPSIASISFHGNSSIKTDALLESLKQIGFSEGRVFNPSVFDHVEQELRHSYFSLGKYGVEIEKIVTPLERNRVAIQFDISESDVAKIKQINIVGNKVFADDELLDLFKLTTSRWHSFFTKTDQYSKQKLSADLESMRSHYLDNGYINFSVDSTQVSITPNKKDVYITINISEGLQFSISEVKLAGDFVVPEEKLLKGITISPGTIFSRAAVTQTSKNLTEQLGKDGYAFANVNAIPDIKGEKREVDLTFFLDPGKRVYVRRINFEGNAKTRDEVLRREMRQIEGGWISTKDVERSRVRLERLGFFEEVNIETPAVPGTTDQVDINVSVIERSSGNLMLGAGFSQDQGVVLQGSISQENFLGTGNKMTATVNNSSINRTFAFSYLNPYYTVDGVSRGFHARYREVDADDANISDYVLDEVSAGVSFGIPISEYDFINVGFSAEHMDFNEMGDYASEEIKDFADEVDGGFYTFLVTGSWAKDSRNRRIFPDKGSLTYAGAEIALPGGDLRYFKLTGKHQRFFPLFKDYVLMLNGDVGFGDGYGGTEDLPLIENFFAGGTDSVRGFEENTLGPRETGGEEDPLGGSFKLVGNAEVIVPVPFIRNKKSTQLSAFFDIGNVYGPQEIDLGNLRYSTGLSTTWLSPFGALTFSYAIPIQEEPDDELQQFQFSFGSSF
uniref:Outer membrane protein assembly factor BamA n=1 Tax=Candidatus Kentrum sp. FM TaxID=2126340 RepID=A0A450SJC9_9GAMM|nr:MAG: outer membrane protein insertion porin family [Candidatus Kentron sp. FM]VFJ53534.1 MAG: outer membrane protein insertion porin family [Candidatus Kentron sp. FM]VFK09945.1 MAG: outer membrane protein insertion porin family [Candidatus Kentron sp. FM]